MTDPSPALVSERSPLIQVWMQLPRPVCDIRSHFLQRVCRGRVTILPSPTHPWTPCLCWRVSPLFTVLGSQSDGPSDTEKMLLKRWPSGEEPGVAWGAQDGQGLPSATLSRRTEDGPGGWGAGLTGVAGGVGTEPAEAILRGSETGLEQVIHPLQGWTSSFVRRGWC